MPNYVCNTFLRGQSTVFNIFRGSLSRVSWLLGISFSAPGNDSAGTIGPAALMGFPCMGAATEPVPGFRWFGPKRRVNGFAPISAHCGRSCTPRGRSGPSLDVLEPSLTPGLSTRVRFEGFGHSTQPSSPQPNNSIHRDQT